MISEPDRVDVPVELGIGSVIIERYKPDGAGAIIQWIAQFIDQNGDLQLLAVCETRHEALMEADRRG